MRYKELGRTGMRVSIPGLGAGRLREVEVDGAARLLNRALDLGVNYIDTARRYPTSEEKIGAAIAHRRKEYYLATKTHARDAEGARQDLETSLRELRTDWVDVCHLHNVIWEEDLVRALAPGGALDYLERAKQEGKVRYIGITSHRPDMLARAARTGQFATALVFLNLIHTDAISDLLPVAREYGMGVVVMKPVVVGRVEHICQSLRFVLAQGVDTIVPGVTNLEQLEMDIAACQEEVGEEERAALLRLSQEVSSHCRVCLHCRECPQGIGIPWLLSLAPYAARYGVSADFQKEWQEMLSKASTCRHSEPCRRGALCEIRCPYHLSIRPTILALGGASQAG